MVGSLTQSLALGLGVYLVSLAFRRGIDWDKIYAPYEARRTLRETRREWPWCNEQPVILAQPSGTSMGELQPYKYKELTERREIRLLKVSCIGNPKRFIGELVSVSLDGLPVMYLAISYTWGGSAPHGQVEFSGKQVLSITESAFTILKTLFNKGETMHVWIDGLCINQGDNVEKSRQVRLMDEIYAKAQQVVICLGEATADSNRAMDFIPPLRNAIRAVRLSHQDQSLATGESIMKHGGFDFTSPSWVALGNLFRRPWFQRMWVVQEAVMGRDPVFVCGTRAIEWDLLAYIATRLFQHALDRTFWHNPDDESRPLAAAEGIGRLAAINEARALKQEGEPESFQDTLIGMYSFSCSDSRDKIFALLGIATDTKDVMLDPDYDATVEEIYTRTARYLLQRDSSMVILHHAGIGFPRKYETLPSWVPQWELDLEEDDRLCLGGMHKWSQYKAAGDSLPKIRAAGADILAVHGIIVDVVSEIGAVRREPVLDTLTNSKATELAILQEAERMMGRIRSTQGEGSENYTGDVCSWDEAYWRTLVANNALTKPAPAIFGDYFAIWKRHLEDPTAEEVAHPDYVDEKYRAALFSQVRSMASKNRRFFSTEKGLIGLTSPGTLPSDPVCILLGGVTPFIIRKNPVANTATEHETWILVGEAYVHGLMNGEALNLNAVEELHLV